MSATNDIILSEDSQLQEVNGDFVTGENDNNLIYYNLVSHKGHYRTNPLIGTGIDKYLNSSTGKSVISTDIQSNLQNDVFKNPSVDISEWPILRINKVVLKLDE